MKRSFKRAVDKIRPLKMTPRVCEFADGSVMFEIGKTKVICAVTLGGNVPPFLRGKNKWWLTASYSLLPASTKTRVERESASKRNERSVEISRLIGRSLRSILNLDNKEQDRTIHVDCDVIQADGGTRTACITGAFIALRMAEQRWKDKGLISESIIMEDIAAVSAGVKNGKALLDLDFAEDSNVQADFNFVLTRSGSVIEIQGAAEQSPISWDVTCQMREFACKGVADILAFIDEQVITRPVADFSLGKRLQQASQ